MPPPRDYVPKLLSQRGRAYVNLNGKQVTCGRAGTPEARAEYDRLVAQWLARGRRPPEPEKPVVTVGDLAAAWLASRRGRSAGEARIGHVVAGDLTQHFGSAPAGSFGPKALKALRGAWEARGLARSTVNKYVAVAREAFRWAVEEEILPGSCWESLRAVRGLRKGQGGVERPRVAPAPEDAVAAVLGLLPARTADLVRLQRLTGMRSGELLRMRPCDLDRSGAVWVYRLEEHKADGGGEVKRVAIGPRAQAILAKYLARATPKGYLFPGAKSGHYRVHSYASAVREACVKAGVEPFWPHRLRHSAAHDARERLGLDEAQAMLGHANANMSDHYSRVQLDKAIRVAEEIG